MSDNEARERPQVRLVIGRDGNAIVAACRRAAVKAKWSPCDWAAFMLQATFEGGDYDNLLRVVMEHFDVI